MGQFAAHGYLDSEATGGKTGDMAVNGWAIRAIREGKGVSQTALATQVGLSPSALSRIERGERGRRYLADPTVLTRIAAVLGVTVAAITRDEAA